MAFGMGPLALVPVRAQDAPNNGAAATTSATPQIQVDNSPLARSTGAVTSFAPIVEKVTPSIVTVSTTRKVSEGSNPLAGNPMLRRFFGIPEGPDGDDQGGGREEGLGSGVIVSSDGLILTNNHVAEAGDKIVVQIGDHGRKYDAKVVGNDPTSDLALLRIDAKNLPVLTFADSDQVKVGDIALAIGNPFALTDTVTMGIVSALGRSAVLDDDGNGNGPTHYEDFIQTDASINPGNSGGALVDTEGRLIGINTAIYSRSGGNQGIGFAVPSNLAHNVIDNLLKYGKVSRGYLGTEVQELNPDLAEQFKLPDDQQGALISQLLPGSAAEKAGLQTGDIITAVNGKPVTDPMSLRLSVGGMRAGDQATVTYLRDGQSKTANVTLGGQENPSEVVQTNTPGDSLSKDGKVSRGYLGAVVQKLNPDLAEQFKAPDDQQGALISRLLPGSAAEKAGLQSGDIITAVNGKAVTDPMSLRLSVGGMKAGDQATVTYLRDGQSKTSNVTLEGEENTSDVAQTTPPQNDHPNVLDGITVGDLDDATRGDLKVPADVKGVLVTDVASDSVGYDAGLRKGDIVLDMDHKPLASADQAVDEGNKIAREDKVLLQVWSNARTEFMVLKPGE